MPLRALTLAVVESLDAGQRVPCTGPHFAHWTDPRTLQDIADALDACHSCHLIEVCRTACDTHPPRSVVQGGMWWTDRQQPSPVPPRAMSVSGRLMGSRRPPQTG